MKEAQSENIPEPLKVLDWHEVAERMAKRKKLFDEWDIDPSPGAPTNGKVRYDYLRLLTLRLAEDAKFREIAAPWFHHTVLDVEIKRDGVIDKSTIVTAFPLGENTYRVSIAETKGKYKSTPIGVFDLEGAVETIKKAVQEIWQNT